MKNWNNQESKNTHFRTWKSGKIWLYGAAVLVVAMIGSGSLVHADTTTQASETVVSTLPAQTSSSSVSSASISTSSTQTTASTSSSVIPNVKSANILTSSSTSTTATSTKTVAVTSIAQVSAPSNAIGKIGTAYNLQNGVSATDATGKVVSFSQLTVTVFDGNGKVVTTNGTNFTPTYGGDYSVNYSYVDKVTGKTVTAVTDVSVPSYSTPSISSPSDAVGTVGVAFDLSKGVSGTNASGTALAYSDLSVEVTDSNGNDVVTSGDTFTPTVGGDYSISYSYTDPVTGSAVSASQSLSVPIQGNTPTISAPSEGTANVGDSYDVSKGVTLTASDGTPLPFSDLAVDVYALYGNMSLSDLINNPDDVDYSNSESIDLNADGTSFTPTDDGLYFITYSYTDPATGDTEFASQVVSVPKTQVASITVPQSNQGKVNTAYDVSKGVSGTDSLGNAISYADMQVTVTGPATNAQPVNLNGATSFTPTTSGLWIVDYTYTDSAGVTAHNTQLVHIAYTATPSITAPSNSIGSIGQTFDVSQGVSATDSDGNALDFADLTLNGFGADGNEITFAGTSFTPQTEGDYEIFYTYTDPVTGATAWAIRDVLVPYTTTPSITVPSDSIGQKGMSYDVTKGVVIKDSQGNVVPLTDDNVYIEVTDADGNDIDFTGNTFIPTADGDYTIYYSYFDSSNGNSAWGFQVVHVGLTTSETVTTTSTAGSGKNSTSVANATKIMPLVSKVNTKVTPKKIENQVKALPQTGEKSSVNLVVMGVILLLSSSLRLVSEFFRKIRK
ncbi:MAG: KxYKxGKxW signal peptide domain-containing protein [Streptococcaceae bacterium]|nr:KxYKxGKxW signal peptide domain-containing protein [Streptococcaceae bacterium]